MVILAFALIMQTSNVPREKVSLEVVPLPNYTLNLLGQPHSLLHWVSPSAALRSVFSDHDGIFTIHKHHIVPNNGPICSEWSLPHNISTERGNRTGSLKICKHTMQRC